MRRAVGTTKGEMNLTFENQLIEFVEMTARGENCYGDRWRRLADLNRRITVLQTVALPLG